MLIKKPRGTKDYFREELRKIEKVSEELKRISKKYNFERVVTPTFEEKKIFERTSGEHSDIVSKEMFELFNQKNPENKKYVLRPEGTAPIVRFLLENKLDFEKNLNLYYFEKMFRYERPQKGRLREFFQYGVEMFGEKNIFKDLQIILIAKEILENFNIKKYILKINNIGSFETRKNFSLSLEKYLLKNEQFLSPESNDKIKKNIFRVLDSKSEEDKKILEKSPKISDFLNKEEKKYFEEILFNLKKLNIDFSIDETLVRGLDYYNDLVFEFVSIDEDKLGSKNTIIAGGRYDCLVNKLHKDKSKESIGFAIGIERLIMSIDSVYFEEEEEKKIMIIPFNEEYYLESLELMKKIDLKFNFYLNLENTKFKNKLEKALKNNYNYIIIVDKEILNKKISLKNLKERDQKLIFVKDLKNEQI